MPKPLVAALMLALLAAGCNTALNPINWSGDTPQSISPEATRGVQGRPLVAEVTALSIEPMDGGVIVRATGRPTSQGYWDAALVPTPREAVDGVMTYRFVANPPVTPMPQGTPWSAGIEAAAFISAYDLDSIREITAISATNQRSSRR